MINIRNKIIEQMSLLNSSGLDCSSCQTSECCTFVKNSMQITPLETIELIIYLHKENRIDDDLIQLLKDNIKNYRLNIPLPGDGKRLFSRRSYTCPFLKDGSLACSISRFSKPYGCLAYNPTKKLAKDSSDCSSDQQLLDETAQEFIFEMNQLNSTLQQLLKINFDKLPIPMAIIEVISNNSIEDIANVYESLA